MEGGGKANIDFLKRNDGRSFPRLSCAPYAIHPIEDGEIQVLEKTDPSNGPPTAKNAPVVDAILLLPLYKIAPGACFRGFVFSGVSRLG